MYLDDQMWRDKFDEFEPFHAFLIHNNNNKSLFNPKRYWHAVQQIQCICIKVFWSLCFSLPWCLILNGVFVGSITTAVAFDVLADYHLIALSFCLTMSVTSQPYRRNYSLSLFISLSGLTCSDCSITFGRVFSSNWTNLQIQNREPYAHYYTWWNASFASRAEAMA